MADLSHCVLFFDIGNTLASVRVDSTGQSATVTAAETVSEDFFVGPKPHSPAPDPNPNYHMPADNAVNALYAADIARAVAAAAWIASTR